MTKHEGHLFEPWCSQHQMHPEKCWYEHNPAHPRPEGYDFEKIKEKVKSASID